MNFFRKTADSLSLLDKSSKRKYLIGVSIQSSLSILDIVGVALIGVVAFLASTGQRDVAYPFYLETLLRIIHIDEVPLSNQIVVMISLSLFIFILKSFLALLFSRVFFRFLAKQQSKIANELLIGLMDSDYTWMKKQDPHYLSLALTAGISAAMVNALGQLMLIFSEITLLLIFFTTLTILNPGLALGTLFFLSGIIYVLNVLLGSKISLYNSNLVTLRLKTQAMLFSIVNLFREIRVLKRGDNIKRKMSDIFYLHSRFQADDIWIHQIPKYVLEIGMLLGVAFVFVVGKITSSDSSYISLIAIYLAGAGRIFPSLLRIQSAVFSLRAAEFEAQSTIDTLNEIQSQNRKIQAEIRFKENSFVAQDRIHKLELRGVSFRYPEQSNEVISSLNLVVNSGDRIALVGPSGSGKSTICDILLGLIEPTKGDVLINEVSATTWFRENAGAISYMPQETNLVIGTILENICLGIELNEIDFDAVELAISQARLKSFIQDLPQGLDTVISAEAKNVSGGQRQRIGLARALYSKPSLLILDEATSAIDGAIEDEILQVIHSLPRDTIVVFVAHRLSAIRDFPRILYVKAGELSSDGDLKTIMDDVPEFEKQIRRFIL